MSKVFLPAPSLTPAVINAETAAWLAGLAAAAYEGPDTLATAWPDNPVRFIDNQERATPRLGLAYYLTTKRPSLPFAVQRVWPKIGSPMRISAVKTIHGSIKPAVYIAVFCRVTNQLQRIFSLHFLRLRP